MKQIVKKAVLLQCLILWLMSASAQDWRLKIDDPWFKEYGVRLLKVGDTIPDIKFPYVLNNYGGFKKLSDIKKKLIILDFWNTSCKSCIDAFPKMEKLQKEFPDDIQVILVNYNETEEQIKADMATASGSSLKKRWPNLPSIVLDKPWRGSNGFYNTAFGKVFPLRGVPFHVWISNDRVIRVIGDANNTYPEKIRAFLEGEEVYSKRNLSSTPYLTADKRKPPYYSFLSDFKETPLQFASFLTPYNNELSATTSGAIIRNLVDTISKTVRSTYVNVELLRIYSDAAIEVGKQYASLKGIYSPDSYGFVFMPNNFDTLKLTTHYFQEAERRSDYSLFLKDHYIIQSNYCYEQVVPINISTEEKRDFMLSDLNRYTAFNLGVMANVEKRSIPCFVLIRTSENDKIGSRSTESYYTETTVVEKGKKIKNLKSAELGFLISHLVDESNVFNKMMLENKKNGRSFLILNKTGWDQKKKIDIKWPDMQINSIEDLRKILLNYDLDIREEVQEMKMLEFRNSTNSNNSN